MSRVVGRTASFVLAGGTLALLLLLALLQPRLVALQSSAAVVGEEGTTPQQGQNESQAEAAPPPNQTYIGTTKCASCHFEQYTDWRRQQEKHVKAYDILPAPYRSNAECLKCHTTGYGEESGFSKATDRHLAGVSCEACHGPGSIHAAVSKPFANKKQLSPQEEKTARGSIWLLKPGNTCVRCHSTRAHQKHPDYNKS